MDKKDNAFWLQKKIRDCLTSFSIFNIGFDCYKQNTPSSFEVG